MIKSALETGISELLHRNYRIFKCHIVWFFRCDCPGENAFPLKLKYFFWQKEIWNISLQYFTKKECIIMYSYECLKRGFIYSVICSFDNISIALINTNCIKKLLKVKQVFENASLNQQLLSFLRRHCQRCVKEDFFVDGTVDE